MALDARSVDVNPGNGRAVFQATNLPMPDYQDFVSSVTGATPVPGIVSFRVEWGASKDVHRQYSIPNRSEGTFLHTTGTCTWSGRTQFAEFATNTNNPTIFAEVGRERNGVFFPGRRPFF
jgi:hypothetical protein